MPTCQYLYQTTWLMKYQYTQRISYSYFTQLAEITFTFLHLGMNWLHFSHEDVEK